ncbi:hypothetical protein [Paracoccus ravus]|uniref:hypothetical protein n=1 Tax=Paracoccus ravus TaxID=2447760 RepID=UPI00106E0DAD|nr:hypothetical protein [Paracoccus ravus]
MTARIGQKGRGTPRWRSATRAIAALVLLPFLALSLIHAGTMPASDATGRITLVLCGSDGPVEMVVAPDGTVTPASEQSRPASEPPECIWSLHTQPALSDASDPAPDHHPVAQRIAPLLRKALVPAPGSIPVPEARAPPLLS